MRAPRQSIAASFVGGTACINSYQRSSRVVKSSMASSRARGGADVVVLPRLRHAASKRGDGGVEFPLLVPGDDAPDQLPDVGHGLEVVAPIALHGDPVDEVPGEKLLQRRRDVRAR